MTRTEGRSLRAGLRRAAPHVAQFLVGIEAPDRADAVGHRVVQGAAHHFLLVLVAGGGHHQVVPTVVERALGFQLIEHLLLVGVGPQLKPGQGATGLGALLAARQGQLMVEPRSLDLCCGVGLELALLPVGVKRVLKLAQHRRRFQGRQAHVPLQAIEQGGTGEIGGTDVGGAGAAGAVKQPGLGVQAGAARVGADAHLGPAFGQPVEGASVGGAHVNGGEHTQGAARLEMLAQLLLQQAQAAPLDEGAEQIDAIG